MLGFRKCTEDTRSVSLYGEVDRKGKFYFKFGNKTSGNQSAKVVQAS